MFFTDFSFTKVDIINEFSKILFMKVNTCHYLSNTQRILSIYPDYYQA